ncbi:MAG: phosphatidylglycerophosphatase A [Polyangiaceae bacterium]|nr:phosphatidylglycerophosphatase A [Polyangiaceae bacterium]
MDSDRAAELIATWFGCGLSPKAPGTVGSLGAVPLHLLLRRLPLPLHVAATVGVTGLGVWAAQRVATRRGETDPQRVVIDEVAGVLIALGLVRRSSLKTQAMAWVLFRAFDILKPGPVHAAEDLSPEGVGIMADDVVAGVLAGLAARWLA